MKKMLPFIFVLNFFLAENCFCTSLQTHYLLDAPNNILEDETWQNKQQILFYSCASACIISALKELNPRAMSHYCDEFLNDLEKTIHRQINMSKYGDFLDEGTFPIDVVEYFEDNYFFRVTAYEYFNFEPLESKILLTTLSQELRSKGEALYHMTRELPKLEADKLKTKLNQGAHLIIPFMADESSHFFHIRKKENNETLVFMDPTFGSNHEMPWEIFEKIIFNRKGFFTRGELYHFFGSIIVLERNS